MEKDIQNQINRWLLDDEKAFEQVFYHYYPRLYRYAFRYLKNEFWAEELSMEVLARIWEKRTAINHAETFENYLFTAVRNHLINHWQRKIDGLLSLETLPADVPFGWHVLYAGRSLFTLRPNRTSAGGCEYAAYQQNA